MHRLGYPSPPVASEFIRQGYLIPDWYRNLIYATRAQVASLKPPLIDVAPRPFADDRDLVRTDLLQELGFVAHDL
jgi:hypothetical protein